jgi:hypothetical protein
LRLRKIRRGIAVLKFNQVLARKNMFSDIRKNMGYFAAFFKSKVNPPGRFDAAGNAHFLYDILPPCNGKFNCGILFSNERKRSGEAGRREQYHSEYYRFS